MTTFTRPTPAGPDLQAVRAVGAVRSALNAALRGKGDVVERVLACLLARGHLLIEDLPGLGKTTLAKALAAALGGAFARVQCTPDLPPGDVTGFRVYDQKAREFESLPGPGRGVRGRRRQPGRLAPGRPPAGRVALRR